MPSQEVYDEMYYDESHRRWFEHPNTPLFNRIAKLIPAGKSVLDVGCGRGDFLRFLHHRRPDLKLTGIDYSDNRSEGICFLRGDVLNLDVKGPFDFVVSLAVIEHVQDCVAFVHRLQQLTSEGGLVVVMTLNEGGLLYGLARAGLALGFHLVFDRLYSRHHLHHFTRKSLHYLLESCDLKVAQQIMHNAPLKAMDLPVKNPVLDAILRTGVGVVFITGSMTSKTYLQTAICSPPLTEN